MNESREERVSKVPAVGEGGGPHVKVPGSKASEKAAAARSKENTRCLNIVTIVTLIFLFVHVAFNCCEL